MSDPRELLPGFLPRALSPAELGDPPEEYAAAYGDLGATPSAEPAPPCYLCASTSAARSACPHCGRIVCRSCAERPYAFCCDGEEVVEPDPLPGPDPLAESTWLGWLRGDLDTQAHSLERLAREAETKPYLDRDGGAQRACEAYAKRLREMAALARRPFP